MAVCVERGKRGIANRYKCLKKAVGIKIKLG